MHLVFNHTTKAFQTSTDSFFVEKVRDIVGLHLSPPKKAIVLCVDEKSQIQALDRTQPMLPIGVGYVESVTHDYIPHCTMTLFAALDIVNAGVIAQWKSRHRHQEYLGFLNHIEAQVPEISKFTPSLATTQPTATKPLRIGWSAPPVAYSSYADLCLMAQPGRNSVQSNYATGNLTRYV